MSPCVIPALHKRFNGFSEPLARCRVGFRALEDPRDGLERILELRVRSIVGGELSGERVAVALGKPVAGRERGEQLREPGSSNR